MKLVSLEKPKSKTTLAILCFVTIAIGIVSGLAGMLLALLLHFIQHCAFGYSPDDIISQETFFDGVNASSSLRRVTVMSLCGLIAGLGWWLLYRYGKPLVSIANAIKSNKPHMPILSTIINALLQIITVAMGSPLGREVAPRELGAAFACWISMKTALSVRNTQIMVACAAGAGLAAVYNVPFGGALFTLEVLLCSFRLSAVVPAFCTAAIATVVSWIGLGNEAQYHLPVFSISYSLVIWAIITGPIFGVFAYFFAQITAFARSKAPKDWLILILCPLNFVMIGLLSIYFPALLGNGKGPAQLGFADVLNIELAATLLVLRFLIVWTSFRAGAQGGLLTPGFANGVLLAIVLGGFWSFLYTGPPLGAFAVIGAAAFLAASQKMPITAIILTAEFTNINFNFLIPILLAVTGSISMFSICNNGLNNRNVKSQLEINND